MDTKLSKLIAAETKRQDETLPLIASENFCSQATRAALGSVFVDKYAEGEPGKRYYAGNKVVDELERHVIKQLKDLFIPREADGVKIDKKDWYANVQPLSGSPANLAVYAALLKPGDTILAMSLTSGGHLSHGHAVTLPGQLYKIVNYEVDPKDNFLHYDQVLKLAKKVKPQLIIVGASAYPRILDFEQFGDIAKKVKAYLMADISHLAGLVAVQCHPSPFPYVDVVTSTTHKTLRGPRSAFIIARVELGDKIKRGVFPGVQGGPHLNQIAALSQALAEAKHPKFNAYIQRVIRNTQTLAQYLGEGGLKIITGGTDNHLLLVDITATGLNGRQAQEKLEKVGIIVNANTIPFDTGTPMQPSGIRLGTAAITTIGAHEKDIKVLAELILDVLLKRRPAKTVALEVKALRSKLKLVEDLEFATKD
ncbi:MAG: serine hydroxymethyltransferase [bacterium]|nr:serine hydroxymethyltransferase [bacterium]